MPKEVIQSNWFYGGAFSESEGISEDHKKHLDAFELLDKHGFDKVSTGSVWAAEDNFPKLTEYFKKHISPEHFLGVMQTTWERIDLDWMDIHDKAIKQIKIAKSKIM